MLPLFRSRYLVALVVCMFATPLCRAESDLLDSLPGTSTNFVAVVHARELREALAQADSRVVTRGTLPTWLDQFVVGAHVRIGYGERVKTYFLAKHPQGITLTSVAKQRGGLPDRIGMHSAFLCAPGDYLVEIAPRIFALVRPGVRQEVVEWVERIDAGQQDPLSESLKSEAQREGQLVIALDLTNSIFEAKAKSWLESHDTFAGQTSKINRLAKLAASASVASAVVTLADGPQLEVRVTFATDINVEAQDLTEVIRTAIAERGAALPELDAAEPAIEGRTLVIRAAIGEASLRKLLSLVLSPQSVSAIAPDAEQRAAASEKELIRQYIGSVNKIIYDLERANRQAKDYLRTATWHDNFANQIDELPTAGIPPEFVAYGTATANRLRALAVSLRGQAVTVDAESRSVTYNVEANPSYYGVGLWGGWSVQPGYVQVTSNVAEVRQRLSAAVAAGAQEREQIWQLQAEDRQRAVQEFETKFGEPFASNR